MMAHSLQSQGRTELILCAVPGAEGLHERVRARFGWVTPIVRAETPDEAIDRALDGDAFAVIEHDRHNPWWTRLATEPTLSIFDSIEADGELLAFVIGRVGADEQRIRLVDGPTATAENQLIAASGTLHLCRITMEGVA